MVFDDLNYNSVKIMPALQHFPLQQCRSSIPVILHTHRRLETGAGTLSKSSFPIAYLVVRYSRVNYSKKLLICKFGFNLGGRDGG